MRSKKKERAREKKHFLKMKRLENKRRIKEKNKERKKERKEEKELCQK